ncbi:hypothetical protein D9M72_610200 [compost metagenome]
MSPASAAGRANRPKICGINDGGVVIIVARPTSATGAATQSVTQSGYCRIWDQTAAAMEAADPASMNSLPTRSRSTNSGTGS